jgi:hypothetical protein
MIAWSNTEFNFDISERPSRRNKRHPPKLLRFKPGLQSEFLLNTNVDWAEELKTMENILTRANLNSEQIKEFLSHFKPIFESFQFTHPVDFSIPDNDLANRFTYEIDLFVNALKSHTSQLLVDRFQRELEIYISDL